MSAAPLAVVERVSVNPHVDTVLVAHGTESYAFFRENRSTTGATFFSFSTWAEGFWSSRATLEEAWEAARARRPSLFYTNEADARAMATRAGWWLPDADA